MSQQWVTAGVILLAALTAALALFGAFLLWRDGYIRGWHRARKTPPMCPDCGYNLSGLTRCRCPECGAECTLDRLWQHAIIGHARRNQDERSPVVDTTKGHVG